MQRLRGQALKLCLGLLLFVAMAGSSFAHHAPAPLPPDFAAAIDLPFPFDSADLCIASKAGENGSKDVEAACDACRLAGAVLLPTSPKTITRELQPLKLAATVPVADPDTPSCLDGLQAVRAPPPGV